MEGKWCFTVILVLFAQDCMSFGTQDLSDIVQDLPEIANEPIEVVQNQTDLPATTQTPSTTTQTPSTTTRKRQTTPKQPGKEQIERFGEQNYPFSIDCEPGEPLTIPHVFHLQENELLVWTMKDTPDFFYATKWISKTKTCEEYTTTPSFFNNTKRDTQRMCTTFFQAETNCAREEVPKKYIAFHVGENSIKELRRREILNDQEMNESLAYLEKLTHFSQKTWNENPDSIRGSKDIPEMLNALLNLDDEEILYATRPYYCLTDCDKRVGVDKEQCQGYIKGNEFGSARRINVTQVKAYGMQLDNEGIPCRPETPCTNNYLKENYCNGGHACARYGLDEYGRTCTQITKSYSGTYCYVQGLTKKRLVPSWTHPPIDTKTGTYCHIG